MSTHLRRPSLVPAVAAVLSTLLVTALLIWWNTEIERESYLRSFGSIAEERAAEIETLYRVALTRQTDVGALFLASQRVDADEFRDFVRQLNQGHEVVASSIAFITPVTRSWRAAFERGLGRDYGSQWAVIRDLAPTGDEVRAMPRDAYYPIRFAEPADFPHAGPGLDLGSLPRIDGALERAVVGGKPILASFDGSVAEHSFRLFVPVYRQGAPMQSADERRRRLLGVSVGVYAYGTMVEQILAGSTQFGQNVLVFASDEPGASPVYVHRSRLGWGPSPASSMTRTATRAEKWRVEREVALADRLITLVFLPARPMALTTFLDERGRFVAAAGLSLALLFGLIAQRGSRARAARREADRQFRLAASVFGHAHEAILITDANALIVDVNEAFTDITGYPRAEVIGRNPRMLASGRHTQTFYEAFWGSLTETGRWQGQFWNRRRGGELFATQTTVSAVHDEAGRVQYYIGLFSDVTERMRDQERIEHLALFDALTDLPNRALAMDRLRQALARAHRDGTLVAVCYMDLDGFKPVNDRHGHAAGDAVLVAIAGRLQAAVREHDTVARLGGDEFLILLTGLEGEERIGPVLRRLHECVAAPLKLPNGATATVTASIGVASFPRDASEPDALLRQADHSMYQAKEAAQRAQQASDDAPVAGEAS
ncbi:MAG: diguanylate cyclase [Methylotetracoccus sp.]